MDFRWLTDDHIHALIEAMSTAKEPYRTRLREVLVAMNAAHLETLNAEVQDAVAKDDLPFDTEYDVAVVETLLSKGIMHNGVVPTMTIPDIARSADLVAQVIARIRLGTLSFEEQDLLDWTFDQAANAYEQAQFIPVRRLERRVRGGLGLDPRLAFLPNATHHDPT